MWRRHWLIAAVAMAFGLIWLVAALDDFDLTEFAQTDLKFQSNGQILSGTLVLPVQEKDPPVAVIVHGDGPQDRFSNDGYLPFLHALLDAGIAVFTWDKPGIGQSSGDWLEQSMADRTQEAIAALQLIRAQPGIAAEKVGFLGFSQAGWVIPQATHDTGPAFSVLIGAAVNWQQQGAYFMHRRLEAQGMSTAEIAAEIDVQAQRDALILAPGYRPTQDDLRGMDPARFAFVVRNHRADATESIAGMTGPVLAVWGADDLNVDAKKDAMIYQANLPAPNMQSILIIPKATHALLRASRFNYQLNSEWPTHIRTLFLVQGRDAFAPGALDHITQWITAQVNE
ncbi:MAG: alpha/beta fold hydrolase [Pseudomonadota bacterium]